MINQAKRRTISVSSRDGNQRSIIQSADPCLLRALFSRWKPERPELLIRLRPRVQDTSHVAR